MKVMDRTQKITKAWIRDFQRLGERSKNDREKFRNFCELAYCAYAKLTAPTPESADEFEERYMRIVNSYQDKNVIRAYPEFLARTIMAVQDGIDILGIVAAELNVLDSRQGQFFTPMSLCKLMAKMNLFDARHFIEERGYITLGEPAAGSGAIVLAYAEELRHLGYDPAIHMLVQATDLNPLAYQMCFIQLTSAGIPAGVIHGNSLSLEIFESAWTAPAINGFYRHHGHLSFDNAVSKAPSCEEEPRRKQLSFFDKGI